MNDKLRRIAIFVFLPLLVLILINRSSNGSLAPLRYLLAAAPIITVLVMMMVFKAGAQLAGPFGLLFGILIAAQVFGLTTDVLWVSQGKGFLLSLFVIAVFLPALFLYHIVNQAGGIQALALALENLITDRGLLLIVIAWGFSAMLEGLAGFGLPVAIVSPMLAGLGVDPVLAVTAVAIGHAWSVTFGDMGVVFQTLLALVQVDPARLAATAAFMLGISALFSGLAVAHLFKRTDRWFVVVLLAGIMGVIQYVCAVSPLSALASFLAGLAGVLSGILFNHWFYSKQRVGGWGLKISKPLVSGVLSYSSLAILMAVITLVVPIKDQLVKVVWQVSFPAVQTLEGFVTAAKINQTYQPLMHPGTAILLVAIFSFLMNRKSGLYSPQSLSKITTLTFKAALPAMIGIISMVGLSSLMDHAGMNLLLARFLSSVFYQVFPLVSPLIGMLGAFATGSNNNSNVLFASLQEGIAVIVKLSPAIIVAAQTTGGALGSMIAPAKIIVGLSTVNQPGRDGEVLQKTILYGLVLGLLMGLVALILTRI